MLDISNTVHGGRVIRTYRGGGLDYRGVGMLNKEKAYEYWCEAQDVAKPTKEQIKRTKDLLRRLGYDAEDYNFEEMDRWEIDDLIEMLNRGIKQ